MSNQNFSDELNQEVSSIKPDLGTLGQQGKRNQVSPIQLLNTIRISRMGLVRLT